MDTIRVQRANVILDIRLDEKEKYMEQGFSVIDKSGNIIEMALSNNIHELRGQVKALMSIVANKDEEIKYLSSQVDALKRDNKKLKESCKDKQKEV